MTGNKTTTNNQPLFIQPWNLRSGPPVIFGAINTCFTISLSALIPTCLLHRLQQHTFHPAILFNTPNSSPLQEESLSKQHLAGQILWFTPISISVPKTTLRWSKAVTSHEMWQETGKQPAKSVVTLAAPTKTPIRWSLKVSQYLCHLSSVSLACLSLNKWWIWPSLFEFLWWSSVCTRLFFIYFFPVACWLL